MEVDPDELHPLNFPKGAALLPDEFFWDCTDEDSPLGNDTGSDVFYSFLNWRQEHPRSSALTFLGELLEIFGVADEGWEFTTAEEVAPALGKDNCRFLSRDETIIALAFAQIVLEGKIHPEVRRRARLAVERQLLPEVLQAFVGSGSPFMRIEKLEKVRQVLA